MWKKIDKVNDMKIKPLLQYNTYVTRVHKFHFYFEYNLKMFSNNYYRRQYYQNSRISLCTDDLD